MSTPLLRFKLRHHHLEPALGTPLDPTKLSRTYMKPALAGAGITKPFRVWHGMRHTSITHNGAVNAPAYVQMRAGHSSAQITERYTYAAQVAFPGAAQRFEDRIFAAVPVPTSVPNPPAGHVAENESGSFAGAS